MAEWEAVDVPWDELNDAVIWNSEIYLDTLQLGSRFELTTSNTVDSPVVVSLPLVSKFKARPAGSTWNLSTTLGSKSGVKAPVPSILYPENVSLGSKFGLVSYSVTDIPLSVSLGSKSELESSGVTQMERAVTFGSSWMIDTFLGNAYIEQVSFGLSVRYKITPKMEYADQVLFASMSEVVSSVVMEFPLDTPFKMSLEFKVHEHGWVRPVSKVGDSVWGAEQELKNAWSADTPTYGDWKEED